MTCNDCTPRALRAGFALLLFTIASTAGAQTNEAIRAHIAQEKAPLLDTLRALVNIESGSNDRIRMATTGIELAVLTVKGRASHAGVAPELGRNALYELSHQILQMRDLSDPARAVKVNWTVSKSGSVTNAIPESAQAMIFSPMPVREQSQRAGEQARKIYEELGLPLQVVGANGGGTDAAFAAMTTHTPVLEGFGLRNFGSHSNNAEYINISSIEPRLYLLTKMIIAVGQGQLGAPTR